MKTTLFPAVLLVICSALPAAGQTESSPAPTPTPAATATPAPTATPLPVVAAIPVPTPRRLMRDLKENSDNVRSQGNFGAQFWLIGNESFFQDFRKPEAPAINPVDFTPRDQPIFTAIIFYGPAHDDKGLAYVTYDLTVHRPDGSVYSDRKGLIGYQNLAASDPRLLQLGRDYLTIIIGADDPAGIYTVDAVVHDNAGKVDLPLKQHFVVQ